MSLKVDDISFSIRDNQILKHVSFDVQDGELLSLLGASGSGKSTIIRIIAGLSGQDSGHIWINDLLADELPPYKRGVVVVFQDIRLFPNMSIEDNVAYSLKMAGMKKEERRRIAAEYLKLVQLEGFGKRRTHELSGGQAQRVALARALASEPAVLLLDEPFSGLDEDLRDDMRTLLLSLHKRLKTTIVMVTHDASEALMMSDRIVYICDGAVIQDALPAELYEHPASLDAACCFGDCSILQGHVDNGIFTLGQLSVPAHCTDGPATLVLRHEGIKPDASSSLKLNVVQSVYHGNCYLVHLEIQDQALILQWPDAIAEGERVGITIDPEKTFCFSKNNCTEPTAPTQD